MGVSPERGTPVGLSVGVSYERGTLITAGWAVGEYVAASSGPETSKKWCRAGASPHSGLQGYLAEKNPFAPHNHTGGLSLGPCGGPRGQGTFLHERGTPVRRDFMSEVKRLAVTLSVGTSLCTKTIHTERECFIDNQQVRICHPCYRDDFADRPRAIRV